MQGGGLLFDLSKRAMITGNTAELDEAIRSKILPYLYNGGEGKWIHCAHLACLRNRDRPKSKQFDEIKVDIFGSVRSSRSHNLHASVRS